MFAMSASTAVIGAAAGPPKNQKSVLTSKEVTKCLDYKKMKL